MEGCFWLVMAARLLGSGGAVSGGAERGAAWTDPTAWTAASVRRGLGQPGRCGWTGVMRPEWRGWTAAGVVRCGWRGAAGPRLAWCGAAGVARLDRGWRGAVRLAWRGWTAVGVVRRGWRGAVRPEWRGWSGAARPEWRGRAGPTVA
ncbi:hypothetical protein GCM10009565_57850 [Amycolatopsis albidoflavus]